MPVPSTSKFAAGHVVPPAPPPIPIAVLQSIAPPLLPSPTAATPRGAHTPAVGGRLPVPRDSSVGLAALRGSVPPPPPGSPTRWSEPSSLPSTGLAPTLASPGESSTGSTAGGHIPALVRPDGGSILTSAAVTGGGGQGGPPRTRSPGEGSQSSLRLSVVSFVVPPTTSAVGEGGEGGARGSGIAGKSSAVAVGGGRVEGGGSLVSGGVSRPRRRSESGSRDEEGGGRQRSVVAPGTTAGRRAPPVASFRDRIQRGRATRHTPTAVRHTAKNSSTGSLGSSADSVSGGVGRRRGPGRRGVGGSARTNSRGDSPNASRASLALAANRFAVAGFVALFHVRVMAVVVRRRAEENLRSVTGPRASFVIQCCWRRYQQRRRLRPLAALALLQPWLRFRLSRLRQRKAAAVELLQRVLRGEQTRCLARLCHQQTRHSAALNVVRRAVLRWKAQVQLGQLKLQRDERDLLLSECHRDTLRMLREERGAFLDMVRAGAHVLGLRPCIPEADYIAEVVALTGCAPVPVVSVSPGMDDHAEDVDGVMSYRRSSAGLPFPGELSRSSFGNIAAAQLLSPMSSWQALPMRLPKSRLLSEDVLGHTIGSTSVNASANGSASSDPSSAAPSGKHAAVEVPSRDRSPGPLASEDGGDSGSGARVRAGLTPARMEGRASDSAVRSPSAVASPDQALLFLHDLFRTESSRYLDGFPFRQPRVSSATDELSGAGGAHGSPGAETSPGVRGSGLFTGSSWDAVDPAAVSSPAIMEIDSLATGAMKSGAHTVTPSTSASKNALAMLPLVLEAVAGSAAVASLHTLSTAGPTLPASLVTPAVPLAQTQQQQTQQLTPLLPAMGAAGSAHPPAIALPRPPACVPGRGGGKSLAGRTSDSAVATGSPTTTHPPLAPTCTPGPGVSEPEDAPCAIPDEGAAGDVHDTDGAASGTETGDGECSPYGGGSLMETSAATDGVDAEVAAAVAAVLPGVDLHSQLPRALRSGSGEARAPRGSQAGKQVADSARVVVRLGRRRPSSPMESLEVPGTDPMGRTRGSSCCSNSNSNSSSRRSSRTTRPGSRRQSLSRSSRGSVDGGSAEFPPPSSSDDSGRDSDGDGDDGSYENQVSRVLCAATLRAGDHEGGAAEEDGVLAAFIGLLCRTEAIERVTLQQALLERHAALLEPGRLATLAIHLRDALAVPPLYAPMLLTFHHPTSMRLAAKLFVDEQRHRMALLEAYDALPLEHLRRPIFSGAAEARRRALVAQVESMADPLPHAEEQEAASFAETLRRVLEGRPRATPTTTTTTTTTAPSPLALFSPSPIRLRLALPPAAESGSVPPTSPRVRGGSPALAAELGGTESTADSAAPPPPRRRYRVRMTPIEPPTGPPTSLTYSPPASERRDGSPLETSAPVLAAPATAGAQPRPRRRHRGPPIPLLRALDPHIAAAARHHRRRPSCAPAEGPPPGAPLLAPTVSVGSVGVSGSAARLPVLGLVLGAGVGSTTASLQSAVRTSAGLGLPHLPMNRGGGVQWSTETGAGAEGGEGSVAVSDVPRCGPRVDLSHSANLAGTVCSSTSSAPVAKATRSVTPTVHVAAATRTAPADSEPWWPSGPARAAAPTPPPRDRGEDSTSSTSTSTASSACATPYARAAVSLEQRSDVLVGAAGAFLRQARSPPRAPPSPPPRNRAKGARREGASLSASTHLGTAQGLLPAAPALARSA